MNRSILLMSVSFSLACIALAFTVNNVLSQQPAAKERVLRHIVMYKFKDDQSKQQVQEVIDAFSALPKKIDFIVSLEHGPNVSAEGKSDGLTYCFVVTFKNDADLKTYLTHPAHDEYVKVVKDRREKVIVFDYWADQ